ncbi:MAG: hypothetical protein ACO1O6_01135 [Bacteroidota bacterium]
MKKINLLALSIFLLLFAFSCKKKVNEVNSDFIGYWTASDPESSYLINIMEDSEAVYYKETGNKDKDVRGNARVRNDKLTIFTKSFHIDEFPVQTSPPTISGDLGEYRMVLDGLEYTCYK